MFTISDPARASMNVSNINELYYITNIDNLASILNHGILSHNAVREQELYKDENDISNANVQNLREKEIDSPRSGKKRKLHDYANFYLQPHNAMMLVIQNTVPADQLCVLRLHKKLLNDRNHDMVIATQNAATHAARFIEPETWAPSPRSVKALSSRVLKGDDCKTRLEYSEFNDRKPKRQAEALFPYAVPATYIGGIFSYNEAAQAQISDIISKHSRPDITVTVHKSLFPQTCYNAFNQKLSSFSLMSPQVEAEPMTEPSPTPHCTLEMHK